MTKLIKFGKPEGISECMHVTNWSFPKKLQLTILAHINTHCNYQTLLFSKPCITCGAPEQLITYNLEQYNFKYEIINNKGNLW